jgi:hypothetical protein
VQDLARAVPDEGGRRLTMAEQTSPTTPAGTTPEPKDTEPPAPASPTQVETVTLLLLGLLWLGTTLWTAHRTIAGSGDTAAATAALTLPVVVTAALLAGTTAALAVSGLAFLGPRGIASRALVGAAAGALCGGVAGALILAGYGHGPSIGVLAATVVAAGLVGGVSSALSRTVHAAGVTGTLCVFLLGVGINVFQSPLKSLLGAGTTPQSQLDAATRLSVSGAVLTGLAAGLVSYFYLRRDRSLTWPAFALAGAFPGLLLLAADGITAIGGSALFSAVGSLSPDDNTTLAFLSGARLNEGLTVGFLGTIVAMIAVGRTLRRPDDSESIA